MLVHANLPLVPSLAYRRHLAGADFLDMVSEGYMAVLRSIEKFDVSLGNRFSTYASRAILTCFYALCSKAQTRRKHFPATYDPKMEADDFCRRRHDRQRSEAIRAVRDVLANNSAGLSETEWTVTRNRFPMLSTDKRCTLSQVGKLVGLSNERVRQIEKASVSKIRLAVEKHLGV